MRPCEIDDLAVSPRQGTKATETDVSIELHAVTLQLMGIKREIVLLKREKRLEDLYHMIDVCLIDIDCLPGLLKKVCMLDVHEKLSDALLDDVKHPSDNG